MKINKNLSFPKMREIASQALQLYSRISIALDFTLKSLRHLKVKLRLSTQHIHHSFYNTSLPCLGKLHFCTSSRSLSPDLGQAAIHLINWPISKAPSVEYSGLPSFARKEMYHLQSSFCVSGTQLSMQHLSCSHQESR